MRSRNYCFIVYPMLTGTEWIDYLKSVCDKVYCSPLHSGSKDGKEIVDHYHVLFNFNNALSFKSVSLLLNSVRGVCLTPCHKTPFINFYDAKLM